jgi:very-short-patch-repair endonuclease
MRGPRFYAGGRISLDWRLSFDVWKKSAIARIAQRQHGVISTAQLLAVGVSHATISRWTSAGWLHRVHHGVYAVGHPGLSNEGWWMAAVLASGPDAVLSHLSAAHLWRILEPREGPIDVTIPTASGRRRRKGIRLHRRPSLPEAATTREYGIPVTTPARTLSDLERVVTPGLYRKAVRQAEYRKLNLGHITTDRTRSETERRMLRICERHGVPAPEVNVPIGPYTVDLFWPDAGLVVELDSFGTHGGRQGFEDDRAMEMYLTGLGLRVRRFSDTQVWKQPGAVAANINAEIRQAAS